MKKRFSKKVSPLLLAFLFFGFSQIDATVYWHNDPAITQDVVNENIDIIGTNVLARGIHVQASSSDILITITNVDSVITGDTTQPRQLYLSVAQTYKITFQLDFDLDFKGSNNGAGTLFDLMVSVTGGGTVEFVLADGKKVSFTSDPNTGGAFFFVGMDTPNNDPTIRFKRSNTNSSNDVEVVVGPKSGVTYIANNSGVGTIAFDGANLSTGNMILRLQDSSYFIVYGHYSNVSLANDFLLTNVQLATLAGSAQLIIENVGGHACSSVQVINENTKVTNYMADPFCDRSFFVTGTQYGFILGADAQLTVDSSTYLDYIGTRTNGVPTVYTPLSAVQEYIIDEIDCGKISGVQELIKDRNPSAFIVDGHPGETPAKISLNSSSAIYFRSGVDCDGEVVASFTVAPGQESCGAGNVVLDVEGQLDVVGNSNKETGLNILSLQVDKTGCAVTVESSGPDCFPQRTFAKDGNGDYLQYGKAVWLINNRMNFTNSSLIHTDEIHHVYERNNLGRSDLSSGPTYIGGETFKICQQECPIPRPTIAFYNSIFRVHTNVGSTGVDFRVPNGVSTDNSSIFRFYNNGRCIDNGYGRVMVLGTDIGSFSNCGQKIDDASHLDVFQETAQVDPTTQMLRLEVGANDDCITEGLDYDIPYQYAVHTLFLNNQSNISIGTNADQGQDVNTCQSFYLNTFPVLDIIDDFFSFETAGGLWCLPEASGTTGQGGIFVDANGTFKIEPRKRANISTMVVKSRNGVIDLPENQVFFDSRVGITQWKINLTESAQRVLVPAGSIISDFTMDWGAVQKDYCSTESFVPYEPTDTPLPCHSPAVTAENLRALPVVEGMVDQFQIKRSRIGDQAHLQVAGGQIRELVFLSGNNTAEAPVGFIVVQDNAILGLGTAHRNVDSLQASVKLGINGITLCANGEATIEINEDIIVDNVCHIVTGTSFGIAGAQKLKLHSHDPKEFRIKSTGLLDLTQFDTPDKQIEFGGSLILVFEPGSRLVLGGGTLIFTDQAQFTFERVLNKNLLAGTQPSDLDNVRVKMLGTGRVVFNEYARMRLVHDEFLGIEADTECSLHTNLTWELNNQAQIQIGTDSEPGGAFQVGNTSDVPDATIDFTLILNGVGALFEINRQGFVGFGVGMANKVSQVPNEWLVNTLENVDSVFINIQEGTFQHNQIRSGDLITAALLAIGPACTYSFTFDLIHSVILGGGNIVRLSDAISVPCVREQRMLNPEAELLAKQVQEMMDKAGDMMLQAKETMAKMTHSPSDATTKMFNEACQLMNDGKCMKTRALGMMRTLSSSIYPIVLDQNGQIDATLSVGIMSGKLLLRDYAKGAQPINVDSQTLFNYLVTLPVTSQSSPRSNIFRDQIELSTLGYVYGSTISRINIQRILGSGGDGAVDHDHSLRIGATSINIDDASGDPVDVIEIRGSDGF